VLYLRKKGEGERSWLAYSFFSVPQSRKNTGAAMLGKKKEGGATCSDAEKKWRTASGVTGAEKGRRGNAFRTFSASMASGRRKKRLEVSRVALAEGKGERSGLLI